MSGTLRGVLDAARNAKTETEAEAESPVEATSETPAPKPVVLKHSIPRPNRTSRIKKLPTPTAPASPPVSGGRAPGKSKLKQDYERLTVYLRKDTKDDLARYIVGKDQDMSDVIQELVDGLLRN